MANSNAAGRDRSAVPAKPGVWQRFMRGSTSRITNILQTPTKSVKALPRYVIEYAERVQRSYTRAMLPYMVIVLIEAIPVYVLIIMFGSDDGNMRWLVPTVLFLAGTVCWTALQMVRKATAMGDHTVVQNLLLAIRYIDLNSTEWPDTAHKLRLAVYIDGAAKGFPRYLKQQSTNMTLEEKLLGKKHEYGLGSLKDDVSTSDKQKLGGIQARLITQLKLFTAGNWDQMMVADKPPKDKTAAPKRNLVLQVLVVLVLIGAIGAIAWFYRGEFAGNVAAAALVIALLALVFMFVPRFADAFSAATAAFKGVKEVAPPSKGPEDEPEAESADKS